MSVTTAKTIVITGATDGIGLAAAKALASHGHRLGLVGRNPAKLGATVEAIHAATPDAEVETFVADLSEMRQVRSVAAALSERYPSLDVLFNNAGATFAWRRESADGIEKTFALNHLAYQLLSNELLDNLKRAPHARIVNTSSSSNFSGKIHLDDLQLQRGYQMMRAYSQSKLANILFTKKLARNLAGTGITVNCFHPGLVRTNFARTENTLFAWIVQPLYMWLGGGLSPEAGADTGVYLIESPEVAAISGEFFIKRQIREPNPLAKDEALQDALLERSEAMIKKALA